MAYGKKYQEDDRPKRSQKIGSLWRSEEGSKDTPLSGWLDLGIDAKIRVKIEKHNKTSDKQPDYNITVEVIDWKKVNGAQEAPKAPTPPEDDVPF